MKQRPPASDATVPAAEPASPQATHTGPPHTQSTRAGQRRSSDDEKGAGDRQDAGETRGMGDGRGSGELTDFRDVDPARARVWLALIVGIALALRIVYVLQSRSSPYFAEPQMDALYHVQWAEAWAGGRDFQPGPFFRAPLYPWFLGLLFKLFGTSLLVPRLVQSLLGALSVVLLYRVGARAFDRRVGLLAAFFASSYWLLIYFDGELQLPTLEVPTYLAAICLSLRWAERRSASATALAGIAWGVAALVRPNVLIFVPLVAIWIAWASWPSWVGRPRGARAVFTPAAIFVLATAAAIAPITIYNWTVGGDRVLISSQAGVNLWIGNNPRSDGSAAIVPGTRPDWWGGYYDSIQQAEIAEGRALKPSEVSRHYTRKALRFVLDSPSHAVQLLLWKLRLLCTDYELGNNADERFFAYRFGPILRWLPLGFGLVAPLGVLGFALSWRRARAHFPLWGFLPVYAASVVAFFVCSRYRVPLIPVLLVFAAHACVYSVDAWRAGRRGTVAWILLAWIAGVLFVRNVPAAIDRSDASGLWQLGVVEAQHENPLGAVDLFRQAIAQNPRFVFAHQDLGGALATLGRWSEARESYERALELDPGSMPALRGLFYVELEERGPAAAAALAERIAREKPTTPEAQYLLGRARCAEADGLLRSGASPQDATRRLEDGLRSFRRGLELRPDPEFRFNCAAGAGIALQALGRAPEAVEAFRVAIEARPEPDPSGEYWRAWNGLLKSLVDAGRADEARRQVAELEQRFPTSPEVRALANEFGRK
jgi:tetratricopeptide (TPR) repeat protein